MGAVFGGFPVRGSGEGLKGAFWVEMGCFAGVLANKGPVKTEKTGDAAGKMGAQAIIPGRLPANPGGLAAATGVGVALTPVGVAATGGGGVATVSATAGRESEALRQVSRRRFRGE